MANYFYDIECYPNYFLIKFLEDTNNQKAINAYIKADIANKDLTEYEKDLNLIKFEVIFDVASAKIIKNDLLAFYKFMASLAPNTIMIGINILGYDNVIVKFLLGYRSAISPFGYFEQNRKSVPITERLNQLTRGIIDSQKTGELSPTKTDPILRVTKLPFISLDVQAYALETIQRKSLKQIEISLNHYNVQELPYPFDNDLNAEQIRNVDIYNNNDLLATRLFYYHTFDFVTMRIRASQAYGVDLMNATKSKMADIIIGHYYCEMTGINVWDYNKMRTPRYSVPIKDIIFSNIKFEHPVLVELLNTIKKLDCMRDKIDIPLQIGNSFLSFKLGGLHSADRPTIMKSGQYYLIDVDGTSYYPSLVDQGKIYPEHLNKTVMEQINHLVVGDRKKFKKTKDLMADVLKIVINTGFFGKYGDENSPLYDPKAKYTITINGQLLLLKLIEKQIGVAEVISANTDGITFKIYPEYLSEFYRLCKEWELETGINLEEAMYEKYIRRDVNNYMAIKHGFTAALESLNTSKEECLKYLSTSSDNTIDTSLYEKLNQKTIDDLKLYINDKYIKTIGCFRYKQDYTKGYNCTIIGKTLINYFAYNIPVETTIYNSTNIYDFIQSQKMGKDFNVYYTRVVNNNVVREKMPHAIRYYVSNKGGTITKNNTKSTISVLSGTLVTIFNKYFQVESFKEYDINYKYYIARVNDLIIAINNQKGKRMKHNSITNGLFEK